ncbi:MAG: ketoacyl-ACP synthase III [Selenomonadaceae bacterium]|nr:ketoacyl-ACP synthase III [Selenomonadaceae bacterium]MBP3723128.1 ketoacyl-ACP synthase III [Selenomonadaceae bacterium]
MKAYVKNIAYYLPDRVEENTNERLLLKTGIERRHIAGVDEVASDMSVKVAEKLFKTVSRDSIDYLLFCTQSPDYYLPTTACILQNRLKLSKHIGALDYDYGCSGYIYGLGLAKGLIESGQAKNVLLLTAETYSKYINPEDNAALPLFGDAATATLIEGRESANEGIYAFEYGTDGAGFQNFIVPVGGARERYQDVKLKIITDKYGNTRTNRNLYMNGAAIMEFALTVVPETLKRILARASLTRQDIDYYVFHQANNFMLKSLKKICKLENLPYWNDIKDYGNTVSNSIPIALCDMTRQTDSQKLHRVMLIGFGVGLSWGGCIVDLSNFGE